MDFDPNDREVIDAGLANLNEDNAVARAIAIGMDEFTLNLTTMAERYGVWPTELLLRRPETAFDDVVIRLTLQRIADELGQRIKVHWITAG